MSYLENENKNPNALINEDSPYLLQHAYNPVAWLAWSDEAFGRAILENKPIFVSIGYSSCHWCHVMEAEVFENEELAKKLNERFICIKVDREERPDLDKHYQLIHQIITRRSGGWPTSIFLTKNKNPFFAGTYIPPTAKYGMMGFGQLVDTLYDKHLNNFDEIDKIGININNIAKTSSNLTRGEFDFGVIEKIKNFVKTSFDHTDGGILGEPKFPHTALLDFMLSCGDKYLGERAIFTLRQMSRGGIYDLVDGGFCRYSVDSFWLVPHFEKMLYDNGPLIGLYARAYTLSGDAYFLKVARECADFMIGKMSDDGLFFSASDADSQGHEGTYFVYDYYEALKGLMDDSFDEHSAKAVLKILGFSKFGNFEGKNIAVNDSFEDSAEVATAIKTLKRMRQTREYPFIDKKIICSWNAMMISGLFELSLVDNKYSQITGDSLMKLTDKLYTGDTLYHCKIDDKKPKIKAFLEDYSFLSKACLDGYKATKNEKMKQTAMELATKAKERFFRAGAWLFSDGEFVTNADSSDTSYMSAIAPICEVLLEFTDEACVDETLQAYAQEIGTNCAYHAGMAKLALTMS